MSEQPRRTCGSRSSQNSHSRVIHAICHVLAANPPKPSRSMTRGSTTDTMRLAIGAQSSMQIPVTNMVSPIISGVKPRTRAR